nr:MAG: hypothetical protein DIU58_13535 [Sphaerobacter thermophilus]
MPAAPAHDAVHPAHPQIGDDIMRERFRHPQGDGTDLVIQEFPGTQGSIWALVRDSRGTTGSETVMLCQAATADEVVTECVRLLRAQHGGRPETWRAVVAESLEPSF